MSDRGSLRELVPDFDPLLEFDYTQRELILLAEKILDADEKPWHEEPRILTPARMKDQARREIYCADGTPDPSISQGMYWRTHPGGRKVRSDEQRKRNGASYYI